MSIPRFLCVQDDGARPRINALRGGYLVNALGSLIAFPRKCTQRGGRVGGRYMQVPPPLKEGRLQAIVP